MSITFDNKDDVVVEQKDVAQQQPVVQKEDQKTQEVAKPVIATLSEETQKPEVMPSVTPIETTPKSTEEEPAKEVVNPAVTAVDTTTEATAEAPVKAAEETVEKVTTIAEQQGVQTPDASAQDKRIVLRVHRNGHPEKHGGNMYSLKSDTGHHYLNRHSDGRWFHTDSKGHKQEVPNFNEKYRIVDEHHVQLANAKKV